MQTAEIIAQLAASQFVEDLAVLSRTLTETAINTCYLQACDEREFKRYMTFDPIADLKFHQELQSATDYNPPPQAETVLEKLAQQALSSGLFGKRPRSWTEVPLAERARLSMAFTVHTDCPVSEPSWLSRKLISSMRGDENISRLYADPTL